MSGGGGAPPGSGIGRGRRRLRRVVRVRLPRSANRSATKTAAAKTTDSNRVACTEAVTLPPLNRSASGSERSGRDAVAIPPRAVVWSQSLVMVLPFAVFVDEAPPVFDLVHGRRAGVRRGGVARLDRAASSSRCSTACAVLDGVATRVAGRVVVVRPVDVAAGDAARSRSGCPALTPMTPAMAVLWPVLAAAPCQVLDRGVLVHLQVRVAAVRQRCVAVIGFDRVVVGGVVDRGATVVLLVDGGLARSSGPWRRRCRPWPWSCRRSLRRVVRAVATLVAGGVVVVDLLMLPPSGAGVAVLARRG